VIDLKPSAYDQCGALRLGEDGSHFVGRILTADNTFRQQKRAGLDYLTQACAAAKRGTTAPSLVPEAAIITSGI